MPANDRTPVTVIGLGAMGTALAEAFVAAGHPTTVWNRSAEKAAPLVAKGARQAGTVEEAVAAGPLIVACLTTYDATREALEPASAALAGRALVTLNTGTPGGARQMAGWAEERGARFLDGAVKNVPTAVGAPGTLLYYGGDKGVFDAHEATLRVLGGDTVHLGDEPDLAALYEQAVGGLLLPALLGFFQGAALVTARGLTAGTLVRYTVKWLEMIAAELPAIAEEIDSGDYTRPRATVGIFHQGIANVPQLGREADIDVSWHLPMHALLERAVADGHRDHSISALVETLRKPE
ncbi:NAD(P)-dependent oxidoreductase [Streptomyces abikoensis]|uniref:NAD(P)-dependent oxidoreductase n=1 Tax=Streptomyces abikoensis TaxID=97398 RepID=UPI001672C252|nr:NAD(P)-binding domain-containing protein [Streptomyces abikoensis]GGP45090.1 6-phosphogluconate dehydrogenase [Streptomyces abikoensis]